MKFNQMVRFLDGNGINKNCPCCQHTAWTIHSLDQPATNGQPLAHVVPLGEITNSDSNDMGSIYGQGMAVTITECNRCGYLRFFSEGAISRWLKAHPSETDDVKPIQPRGL